MIEQFKELAFHDVSLDALKIDFERRELLMGIVFYLEEKAETVYEVLFSGIDRLNLGELRLEEFYVPEINDVEHSEANGYYAVRFICLLGHAQPTFNFSFRYRALTMKQYTRPIA